MQNINAYYELFEKVHVNKKYKIVIIDRKWHLKFPKNYEFDFLQIRKITLNELRATKGNKASTLSLKLSIKRDDTSRCQFDPQYSNSYQNVFSFNKYQDRVLLKTAKINIRFPFDNNFNKHYNFFFTKLKVFNYRFYRNNRNQLNPSFNIFNLLNKLKNGASSDTKHLFDSYRDNINQYDQQKLGLNELNYCLKQTRPYLSWLDKRRKLETLSDFELKGNNILTSQNLWEINKAKNKKFNDLSTNDETLALNENSLIINNLKIKENQVKNNIFIKNCTNSKENDLQARFDKNDNNDLLISSSNQLKHIINKKSNQIIDSKIELKKESDLSISSSNPNKKLEKNLKLNSNESIKNDFLNKITNNPNRDGTSLSLSKSDNLSNFINKKTDNSSSLPLLKTTKSSTSLPKLNSSPRITDIKLNLTEIKEINSNKEIDNSDRNKSTPNSNDFNQETQMITNKKYNDGNFEFFRVNSINILRKSFNKSKGIRISKSLPTLRNNKDLIIDKKANSWHDFKFKFNNQTKNDFSVNQSNLNIDSVLEIKDIKSKIRQNQSQSSLNYQDVKINKMSHSNFSDSNQDADSNLKQKFSSNSKNSNDLDRLNNQKSQFSIKNSDIKSKDSKIDEVSQKNSKSSLRDQKNSKSGKSLIDFSISLDKKDSLEITHPKENSIKSKTLVSLKATKKKNKIAKSKTFSKLNKKIKISSNNQSKLKDHKKNNNLNKKYNSNMIASNSRSILNEFKLEVNAKSQKIKLKKFKKGIKIKKIKKTKLSTSKIESLDNISQNNSELLDISNSNELLNSESYLNTTFKTLSSHNINNNTTTKSTDRLSQTLSINDLNNIKITKSIDNLSLLTIERNKNSLFKTNSLISGSYNVFFNKKLENESKKELNTNIDISNSNNSAADLRFLPDSLLKNGFISELSFTSPYKFSYYDLLFSYIKFNKEYSRLKEYKDLLLNIQLEGKFKKSSLPSYEIEKSSQIVEKLFTDFKQLKSSNKFKNLKLKANNGYHLSSHIDKILKILDKYDDNFNYGDFYTNKNENIIYLNRNPIKLPVL